jgi:transcriptional regulator with XRE-family HTH domain
MIIMEFNEKLQELRKQKGITQEELAEALFVSRTAVSKWESGRGYPNIDSLKALAKFFSVTVDELLSGDELLVVAEEDNKQKENRFRSLVFSLIDISALLLFFLPFFREGTYGVIKEVPLVSLYPVSPYIKAIYIAAVIAIAVIGILNFIPKLRLNLLSLVFSVIGVLLFIVSPQPYAAAFLFVFLVIKAVMLIKKR